MDYFRLEREVVEVTTFSVRLTRIRDCYSIKHVVLIRYEILPYRAATND